MSACRICGSEQLTVFCDLGAQPPANALPAAAELHEPETRYPLRPMLCEQCGLVQLPEVVSPEELFRQGYPYFSSQSAAFVDHAERYVQAVIGRFALGSDSLAVELASNDGYLLQHFARRGIRCYGVEPAQAQALQAIRSGVPTLAEFFDATLVCEHLVDAGPDGAICGGEADLIVANNVLAHVPDLHGFLHGVALLLAPEGVFTVEVPWLRDLVDQTELGTIYHEHFSYFLLGTLERALGLRATPLRVFDVEYLPEIHGGSLRIYACHPHARHAEQPSVESVREDERRWLQTDPLHGFAARASDLKRAVWAFLSEQRRMNVTLCGYAAAAKAATLLSWAGIGPESVPYVADTTPAKQGRHLPGSRIPIVSPERLAEDEPEVIWILAPNWAPQIIPRLRDTCPWGPTLAWQDGTRIHYAPSNELAQAA